ncbi:hypothetical protein HCN44_010168 [Aphidius gifuensis]|uniref:Uncharacterized protein n=1 Tax=Aphidius gifuensis TaxID=684658 RepID=A0A835CTR6_APHGI|nr:hypothetical protein HCN44_010168 [Aphidius gifuensis]
MAQNNDGPSNKKRKLDNDEIKSVCDLLSIRFGKLNIGKNQKITLLVDDMRMNAMNITQDQYTHLDQFYFSRNTENIIDMACCKYKQIKSFDIGLDVKTILDRLNIKGSINQYTLNYYKTGDYKASHNHGHRHGLIGTLFLLLPSKYVGGDIYFGDYNIEEDMDKSTLRFIYFNNEMEPSITKVLTGNRLSLIYNVYDHNYHRKIIIVPKKIDTYFDNDYYLKLLGLTIKYCEGKKNILLGYFKHGDNAFNNRLVQDIKSQYDIIKVAISKKLSIREISTVYELKSFTTRGTTTTQIEDNDQTFSDLVDEKFEVRHKLFAENCLLKYTKINLSTEIGYNREWQVNKEYSVEMYTAYLINPKFPDHHTLDVINFDENNKLKTVTHVNGIFDHAQSITSDWTTGKIYWTVFRDRKSSIKVIDKSFKKLKYIIQPNAKTYMGKLLVYPRRNELFFLSGFELWYISNLPHSSASSLFASNIQYIFDFTIDYATDKLYIIESFEGATILKCFDIGTSVRPLNSYDAITSHADSVACFGQPDCTNTRSLQSNQPENSLSALSEREFFNVQYLSKDVNITIIGIEDFTSTSKSYNLYDGMTFDCANDSIYVLKNDLYFTYIAAHYPLDVINFDGNNKLKTVNHVKDIFDRAISITSDWTTGKIYWAVSSDGKFSIKVIDESFKKIKFIIQPSAKPSMRKLLVYPKGDELFFSSGSTSLWYTSNSPNSSANVLFNDKKYNQLILDFTIDYATDKLYVIQVFKGTTVLRRFDIGTSVRPLNPYDGYTIETVHPLTSRLKVAFNNKIYWTSFRRK